jgi:hypothetical protein
MFGHEILFPMGFVTSWDLVLIKSGTHDSGVVAVVADLVPGESGPTINVTWFLLNGGSNWDVIGMWGLYRSLF